MGKKVLLTGATGFLGSAIAEELLIKGYKLLLTKRKTSDLWRTTDFSGDFKWIDTDTDDWISNSNNFKPEIIINLAWGGVDSTQRDNWQSQVLNINFQQELLGIAKNSSTKLFIGFGSQAEYGVFEGVAIENQDLNPNTSYGIVKVACSYILREFCKINDIQWRWFRVFSVFGEKESNSWLISSVIYKLLKDESIDLTACEQSYAYLYIKDFARAFVGTLGINNQSGVFNFSSTNSITLKELLMLVESEVPSKGTLNFGKLNYRKNQPMLVEGDMRKFRETFGRIEETDLNLSLKRVVEYKKMQYENI